MIDSDPRCFPCNSARFSPRCILPSKDPEPPREPRNLSPEPSPRQVRTCRRRRQLASVAGAIAWGICRLCLARSASRQAVPGVIAVVDSVVAGAIVGIAGLGLGLVASMVAVAAWARTQIVRWEELIRPPFRRRRAKERPSIDSMVRGPGYLEPRPGPGTNSTSSRRRWLMRFGTSAAITGFLSLFVRASSGGFSLQ